MNIESATDVQPLMSFLKKYEETSQFLIGNLREHGPKMTEDPYSGNFKIIKEGDEIVAVFYLARCGNVYAQAISSDYTMPILEACQKESLPIKGFLGDWDILAPLYEAFAAKNPAFRPSYSSKEILYRRPLAPSDPKLSHHPSVRLLTNSDFDQWFPMRMAYLEELNLPAGMSSHLKTRFESATQNRTWWGYFEGSQLISMAGLNSKSESIGQIGGVFTPKEQRQKGLSKATMLHMLKDCRDLHRLTKSILFTGEADIPAQKLYESIDYERMGHFALILS
jgi:hypothetical protein